MGGQTVPVGSTEVNRPAPVCFGETVLPGSTFVKLVFVWQPTTTHLVACGDRAGAHGAPLRCPGTQVTVSAAVLHTSCEAFTTRQPYSGMGF